MIEEIERRIQENLKEITEKQQQMLDCTANSVYHLKIAIFQDVQDTVTNTIIEFHEETQMTNKDFYLAFNHFSDKHYDLFADFIKLHCTRPEILEQL